MSTEVKLLTMILLTGLFLFTALQNDALASHYEPCPGCPFVVVETDKSIYVLGNNATISGHVSGEIFKAEEPVVIQVLSPIEELVRVEVQPQSDGTFSYLLPLHAGLMSIPASYDVLATYGVHSGGTTFFFMPDGKEDHECGFGGVCQYELLVNGTEYEVEYTLNGIIQNITLDTEDKSILIDASVFSKSPFLTLELNPELISASETDETGQERLVNFTVLINGEKAEKTKDLFGDYELMQGADRLIVISKLEEGQNTVEIFGTKVIPEFSTVAPVVLAATVAGLVIWTRSTVREID